MSCVWGAERDSGYFIMCFWGHAREFSCPIRGRHFPSEKLNESTVKFSMQKKSKKTYWILLQRSVNLSETNENVHNKAWAFDIKLKWWLEFCSLFAFSPHPTDGVCSFFSSINLIAFHSLISISSVSVFFFRLWPLLMFDYFTSEIIMQKVFPAPA